MAKQYLLSQITPKIGHRNHSYIWDLTFVDVDTLEVLMCVVDSSYRNYTRSHWDHYIKNECLGIYTGLKRTDHRDQDGLRVINADSQPNIAEYMTEAEIIQFIEIRQQQLGLQ